MILQRDGPSGPGIGVRRWLGPALASTRDLCLVDAAGNRRNVRLSGAMAKVRASDPDQAAMAELAGAVARTTQGLLFGREVIVGIERTCTSVGQPRRFAGGERRELNKKYTPYDRCLTGPGKHLDARRFSGTPVCIWSSAPVPGETISRPPARCVRLGRLPRPATIAEMIAASQAIRRCRRHAQPRGRREHVRATSAEDILRAKPQNRLAVGLF